MGLSTLQIDYNGVTPPQKKNASVFDCKVMSFVALYVDIEPQLPPVTSF